VWVRCHGKAFFDDVGVPIRMLGAHNDITALMRVQEELKKKEEILDMLCTTTLDGYWDWNIRTGECFMSVRWKMLLGYTDAELINRIETWWSVLLPEDVPKLQNAIERHKSSAEPINVALRYRRKDGKIAHMLTQGVAQKDESSGDWARIFGTHTDVSYLEEARAVREASAAKTTFLATMSHEIRTPLNAVLGMAQVLMTTDLTEEQTDCVNTLHNSGA
jgi:two-component system, sensor histidine kinase and response regulator